MPWLCEHDYGILSETLMRSPFEQMTKDGKTWKSIPAHTAMFRQKLVILMKCEKCKKVKKIVEVNPTS